MKYLCDEINQDLRDECKVNLLWLEYKESVVSQLGPPIQDLIDESMGEYEVYIGVLRKRFGTPPGGRHPESGEEYESGTEREFEEAYVRWKERKEPVINLYFDKDPHLSVPPTSKEIEQLSKVIGFKERIKEEYGGWIIEFDNTLDFERKVRRFLTRICKRIHDDIGKKKPQPGEQRTIIRQHYPQVANYLKRSVASVEEITNVEYQIYGTSYDTLLIVAQKSRIALIGDAGSGKTTEIERIAAHFSNTDSAFFPFLVRLNKYVNQSISDLLPPHWTTIPGNQLLVLLDGLDEVETQNRNTAIRQIEFFAEQNPDAHIVVSCRSNFYKTELGPSPASLKDFHSYALLNLSHSAVAEYLRARLGNQISEFERLVGVNRLWPLLEIPFYLVRITDEFLTNGGLPVSKAQLFERLVRAQITYDVDHFRTTIELDTNVDVAIGTLERVALAMEALGRNYISKEEYERLVPDMSRRTLISHYSGWRKTEKPKEQWQFEHNNLQEYLAARLLARQDLDTIKSFISFAPDHRRLFPSWINTIAFLVSILDTDGPLFENLIAWILESQPEVVVKFERDKIDPSTRIELFKKIFEYYKRRQLPIDRDKFDYAELARFAQSEESIKFLITEAENAQDSRTLANAIQLLGDSAIPLRYRQRVTELLVSITTSVQSEDYVRNRALMSLADLNLNSQVVVNEIVPVLRSAEGDWLRFGLYYFLYNSDYLDENIEVFLEGLKYVGIFSQRLFDEQWHLAKGLERATSLSAIKKILSHLKQHINEIDNYSFQATVKAITKNAAVVYKEDPSLLELALGVMIGLRRQHRPESGDFLPFFELSNTQLVAFKKVLSNREDYRDPFSILAVLATQECLEYFVQQYQDRNITNDEVWSFQYHLGSSNNGLYLRFNELINQASANAFILLPPKTLREETKVRPVNDVDLLFNRDAFIEEIRHIFESGNKESLSEDDVFEITKDHWESPRFPYLAIRTLSQISASEPVRFDKIRDIINGWDWDMFRASVLYERFSNDNHLTLSDDQRAVVADWCDKNLCKVDFTTALVTQPDGRGSTSWIALYLWSFLRRLGLTYPKAVLLDMLSFDWIEGHQFLGIDYLETLLTQRDLVQRVFENFSRTIRNDNVLLNHLRFCERHSIREVLPYATAELSNPTRSEEVRIVALDIVEKLGDDVTLLESALESTPDNFKWKLVAKLIERRSGKVRDFLHKVLSAGEEGEQLTAATYLIALQDITALTFYVDWIKRHEDFPESDAAGSALSKLRTTEAIPLLMELLKIGCEMELGEDRFYTFDRVALDVLNSIAMDSESGYAQVRERVQKFIETNISTHKNVNFLYQYLDSLERSFYLNRSTQMSLDEVIAKVRDVTH